MMGGVISCCVLGAQACVWVEKLLLYSMQGSTSKLVQAGASPRGQERRGRRNKRGGCGWSC